MNRAKVFFRVVFPVFFALLLAVPAQAPAMGGPAGEVDETVQATSGPDGSGAGQNASGAEAGSIDDQKPSGDQENPSAALASQPKSRVEVAFVLDTTGSMTALIEGAKKKIWSIANTIVDQNPDAEIYMGLVGYRDLGDEYVTRHYPLTTDIQEIYAQLLTFRADGGGDSPESVNEALDVAVTKLGWSSDPGLSIAGSGQSGAGADQGSAGTGTSAETAGTDATDAARATGGTAGSSAGVPTSRILFLVGDERPHMDYAQDRKYPEVLAEAVRRGIIVNTVQAGDLASTEKVWREIAALGKGEYMAIPQDGGTVVIIVTPYDAQINLIQKELNKTIVPYGSVERQASVRGKAEMYEKAAPASSADMASYVNKSGKGAKIVTGGGDLVADIKSGAKKLTEVPEAELPESLRKMSGDEREAYVAEQIRQREDLSRELAGQVKQRDEFIKNKEAETAAEKPLDSFDVNVTRTLKEQISK